MSDAVKIKAATLSLNPANPGDKAFDRKATLVLAREDGIEAKFELDAVGIGLLGLTMSSVMEVLTATLKAEKAAAGPSVPDFLS